MLTVHGVLLGIFLILTGLVILLRVYHDGELGTNARFVSGFIAMALITWVLLTNFEPARTYGTYRWTIYLVVCFVIGAIGGLIIGCTFHLFLMVLSGLGALAFGLWLLGWKDGLLISTNWGRALFLSLLVLAGLVMAPMVWFAPIVGAAFCGAYLFMLGLDMFFHTGFMYALLCSLDTNPNHRKCMSPTKLKSDKIFLTLLNLACDYYLTWQVYLMLAFTLVLALIGIVDQTRHQVKKILHYFLTYRPFVTDLANISACECNIATITLITRAFCRLSEADDNGHCNTFSNLFEIDDTF